MARNGSAIPAHMELTAEALRRRIASLRSQLRAGVVGSLAIQYLRQIEEDDEALNRLLPPSSQTAWGRSALAPA